MLNRITPLSPRRAFLRRLGAVSFALFLIKGLIWLAISVGVVLHVAR